MMGEERNVFACLECGSREDIKIKPAFDGIGFNNERRVHVHKDGTEWETRPVKEERTKPLPGSLKRPFHAGMVLDTDEVEALGLLLAKPRRKIVRFGLQGEESVVVLDDRGDLWSWMQETETWALYPPLPPYEDE